MVTDHTICHFYKVYEAIHMCELMHRSWYSTRRVANNNKMDACIVLQVVAFPTFTSHTFRC